MEQPPTQKQGQIIDIVTVFDCFSLNLIRADFFKIQQGLNVNEFVQAVIRNIENPQDELVLVQLLKELFDEIDINRQGVIIWKQFSDYLIQRGLLKKDMQSDQIMQYKPASQKDNVIHEYQIEKLIYLQSLDKIIMIEQQQSKIRLYDARNFRQIKEIQVHKNTVYDAIHIPSLRSVATCGNDNLINFWEEVFFNIRFRVKCNGSPQHLQWSQELQKLYVGTQSGIIYNWDFSKFSLALYDAKLQQGEPMNAMGIVSSLYVCNQLELIISGNANGQLLLWNIDKNTINQRMQKLKKEIHSIQVDLESKLIFTAGQEWNIYVWSIFISTPIFKIKGHHHNIVSLKLITNTVQLISADHFGVVKVWDVRSFLCNQTIQVPDNNITSFEIVYPQKYLLAGSKKLFIYKYQEQSDTGRADQYGVVASFYIEHDNIIVTAHPWCLKIWDAYTGKLKNNFSNICKSEITQAIQDDKQVKLYIGDQQGNIITVNTKTGWKIKYFDPHTSEISGLYFISSSLSLISASWDKRVVIHDDSLPIEKGFIKWDKIKHEDHVNCIDVWCDRNLICSAGDDCIIQVYNFRTQRQEGFLRHQAEVKFCKFLQPSLSLMSCDLSGNIYFWGISPSFYKNARLLKLKNKYETDQGQTDKSCICASYYEDQNGLIILGDFIGYLLIWNIEQYLQQLIVKETKQTRDFSKSSFITHLKQDQQQKSIKLDKSCISRLYKWKGHNNMISDIKLLRQKGIIISSSIDCHVKFWNLQGIQLGSLVVEGDPNWSLGQTFPNIQSKKKQIAEKILENIKNQGIESRFRLRQPNQSFLTEQELSELGKITCLQSDVSFIQSKPQSATAGSRFQRDPTKFRKNVSQRSNYSRLRQSLTSNKAQSSRVSLPITAQSQRQSRKMDSIDRRVVSQRGKRIRLRSSVAS